MTASVRVEGLGIRFLFDRQHRLVTPGVARLRRRGTEVWGIRGLDLTIEGGRAVGLVGPSGAGKTTLLRTIAGVLFPDEGRVTVEGRVGALLSVEAGLTPALTGRENCVLLGALAGLPRADLGDVRARSGLGDAFDRPVSSYSQGMYARLGLAMVERGLPSILLLDEVHEALDHEFRRVLESMAGEIVAAGGIVVAAGHDHELLRRLCSEAVLVENGAVHLRGAFDEVSRLADERAARAATA